MFATWIRAVFPTFLVPRIDFVEVDFSMNQGGGEFQVDSSTLHLLWTLFIIITSTPHWSLGSRSWGWRPLWIRENREWRNHFHNVLRCRFSRGGMNKWTCFNGRRILKLMSSAVSQCRNVISLNNWNYCERKKHLQFTVFSFVWSQCTHWPIHTHKHGKKAFLLQAHQLLLS